MVASIHVVPLDEDHLEEAAALVVERYRRLRAEVPILPARYAEPSTYLPFLHAIAEAGPGVAAVRGDRLVGFLTGWLIPSFKGRPSSFSPEWANGAELRDGRRIYEEMYAHLSDVWVANGHLMHLVSVLANDRRGFEAWNWLGFGMIVVDGVRDLQPVDGPKVDVEIRRADVEEIEGFMALNEGLCQHLAAPPTFLIDDEERGRAYYEAWLKDPEKAIWLAYQDDDAVAYIGLGPASDDASTIIRDEKTTSVTGAFTREAARGGGIATALLNRALEWARDDGYERCAVDFESMNSPAARFWLRHFEPVCYSLMRRIDDRAA